jgi:hypothetical protein
MWDNCALQLPAHLSEACDPAPALHEGNKSGDTAGEAVALLSKFESVTGTILCPTNGMQKAGRSEPIGAQHLFDEHPNRTFEFMKGVVQSYQSSIHQIRGEQFEVEFRARVSVISVDPEKPDRAAPILGNLARKSPMNFNLVLKPRLAQSRPEVFKRR